MQQNSPPDGPDEAHDAPPADGRWGRGSGSVLPHLKRSLRARPADPAEAADVRPGAHSPADAGPADESSR